MFAWILSQILVVLVRTYQVTIGMLLPKVCRFYPSCSEYFHPGGEETWSGQRGAERCRTHLPLPSVEPGRLRSAVKLAATR